MSFILLAFLGGMLTIFSPCILPVLPFVFARAGRPFVQSTLPMLAGMAVTFAVIASLATLGGGWAVQANQWGRAAALLLLGAFGLSLLLPRMAEAMTGPLVGLGERLSARAGSGTGGGAASALIGVATGLLWAPCAGPILGILLAGAALRGASLGTAGLLLAYAAGAGTSLGIALLVGGRTLSAIKRSLPLGDWLRRLLGVAVLVGVAAIALGWDTGALARVSLAATGGIEQSLVDRWHGASGTSGEAGPGPLATLPSLDGAQGWINSPPLTAASLRGKTVLVDFWTYSCINCLRSLPYVRAWADQYQRQGLVVIGIHTPEFAFEKDPDNVRRAVRELGVDYPVAIDNDWRLWHAFGNEYWPAHYLIDAQGRVRYRHFGEGQYDETEAAIRQVLGEAGNGAPLPGPASVHAAGVEAASARERAYSPETYVGYARAANFVQAEAVARDQVRDYALPAALKLNEWSLGGAWRIGERQATLASAGGRIAYHFRARDLHLVLGRGTAPVHFRVTIDGHAPGADHGVDVDDEGRGVVDAQRLYQLVRQNGPAGEHQFTIEFEAPGVQAYAFTFG